MTEPTTLTSNPKRDSRVKSGRYKLSSKGSVEADLGTQFRSVRRSQKVSLTTLSEAIGVGIWTIRKHETGSTSLRADLLVRAAAVMNVHPCRLLEVTAETEKEISNGIQGNA